MWPFPSKYPTLLSVQYEGMRKLRPERSRPEASDADREAYFADLKRWKHKVWSKHLRTLSRAARAQFRTQTHPSQSHDFETRAIPYTVRLREYLESHGFVADVQLGYYHLGRFVLSVDLRGEDPDAHTTVLPWLFEGFEVKYQRLPNEHIEPLPQRPPW